MSDISCAITNTVAINLFNKGLAGRIFNEVKKFGAKVVMKNNEAECVLMSPSEYINLMEEMDNLRLYYLAKSRLEACDFSQNISMDELNKKYGITEEDLKDCEDVEFE